MRDHAPGHRAGWFVTGTPDQASARFYPIRAGLSRPAGTRRAAMLECRARRFGTAPPRVPEPASHTIPPVNFDDYCQQRPPLQRLRAAPGAARHAAAPDRAVRATPRTRGNRQGNQRPDRRTHEARVVAQGTRGTGRRAAVAPGHEGARAASSGDRRRGRCIAHARQRLRMDLEQARYLDFANLQRYIAWVGGTFASLVARASSPNPADPQPWAADAAAR